MRVSRFIAMSAAATAALAMVGCASATAPAEPTASVSTSLSGSVAPGDSEALLAFSQCMRDNGVRDFPDPKDGGISLRGSGVDTDSSAFKAAEKACESLVPQASAGSEDDQEDDQWRKVVPGGDCACADGSEFAFWERPADPAKVVFWLDGGGACWDAAICAFTDEETYDWNVGPEDGPAVEGGIFDLSDLANPFAEYSFVYVPYCTGDVHLGDRTREYSPELTVEHRGFVNGTTALAHLVEKYPHADQVVVIGESAGSVASPVYAGLMSDALPDAQITVLADSSGAYPDDPDINTEILGQWGTFETMPDWEVNEGLTARDWGIPRFWVQAGLHAPDIVMARFDYAYDEEQAANLELTGADTPDIGASIDANEAAIEDAGVVQHSYTAPGNDHGVFGDGTFYTMEVNAVPLVDWVEALIAGEPLDDVYCEECRTA